MSTSNTAESHVDRSTGGDGGADDPAGDGPRGRRIAFRVLAALLSLWVLALSFFGLLELVLMWLPEDTLVSILDDFTAEDLAHRTHLFIVGIVMWAMVLAVVVQLRKPARRAAPMLLAVVIALGAAVMYALSGTLQAWLLEEGTLVVPVLLLAWLHPRARDLVRRPAFDRDMVRLAALAAVPWAVYAVDHARLQLTSPATGLHAEPEHWATAALMAIAIVASSFIGASDHDGCHLPAWIAALASVLIGAHSLVFPGLPSALATVWAVLAISWGVAFAVALVRRSPASRLRT